MEHNNHIIKLTSILTNAINNTHNMRDFDSQWIKVGTFVVDVNKGHVTELHKYSFMVSMALGKGTFRRMDGANYSNMDFDVNYGKDLDCDTIVISNIC